jgi:hypothetical protein
MATTRILFNRKKKLNDLGQGLIEIEIYVTRSERFRRSTKIYIDTKYWDEQNKRVKRTHPEYERFNDEIALEKQRIENFFWERKLKGEKIDFSVYEQNKNHTAQSFFTWFEHVMTVSNAELSKGTQKIYARALKYLKEYTKDVPMDGVTVQFLEGFNKYLIENKQLAINSRAALFNKIKKVLLQAVKNDLITYSQNPFTNPSADGCYSGN